MIGVGMLDMLIHACLVAASYHVIILRAHIHISIIQMVRHPISLLVKLVIIQEMNLTGS